MGENKLQVLSNKAGSYLKRNAPTILTCVGGAGVVVTSALTVKSTIKAVKILEEAKNEKQEDLTKTEIVKAVLPAYILPLVSGGFTIAAIFAANGLNKRKQASLIGAYSLLSASYNEYKKKVTELYGEEANDFVRTDIAKDKYEEDPIEIEEDKQLFYDMFSERYFESTMEEVIKAQYYVNRDAAVYSGVPLNFYYKLLGMDLLPEYEDFGWSASQVYDTCWNSWIEFDHQHVKMEDGMECCIINMNVEPTLDYLEY